MVTILIVRMNFEVKNINKKASTIFKIIKALKVVPHVPICCIVMWSVME